MIKYRLQLHYQLLVEYFKHQILYAQEVIQYYRLFNCMNNRINIKKLG